ncbi:MAG: hypothetical protein AAGL97_12615 [Pseudomonadota bacterium]
MMMIPHKAALIGLAIGLAGCTAPASNDGVTETQLTVADTVQKPTAKLGPAISTIKPGAAVSFSHEVSGPIAVEGNGYVTLTINEGYPYGALELKASSDEGLAVLGPNATHTINMADGTTHTWRVDFQGLTDGVHYLNIMATAKPSSDAGEMRSYAVRVEVGDWKSVEAAREAEKPMEMQADGEMAVILEADETIE